MAGKQEFSAVVVKAFKNCFQIFLADRGLRLNYDWFR